MIIRSARPDEAQTLADLAWTAKAFWNYPPAPMEAWREALSPSAASISRSPTFVVVPNHTPAGFYQLQRRPTATEMELVHLWVHPQWIGQGLGRALLAHALEHLVTQGIASLLIDADPYAEGFYRHCGATRIGDTPAPIEGHTDRVRPLLHLTAQAFARNAHKRNA